jgi:hypothetical protein
MMLQTTVIFPNLTTSEPMDADTGADSIVINSGDNLDGTSHGSPWETFRVQDSNVTSVQHMVHAPPTGEHLVHAVPAAPAHGACGKSLHEHSVHAHAHAVPVAQSGGTHLPLQPHSAHGEPASSVSGARGALSSHSPPINPAGHAAPVLDQAGVDPATAATTDAPGSATISHLLEQLDPFTRLQKGIQKAKVRTDGTVQWCNSVSTKPATLRDALSVVNWKLAMDKEFDALVKNKTWHLVPPQQGKNVVDCK